MFLSRIRRHFWFKCFGTTAFTSCFFAAYLYLLKSPAGSVTTVPLTWLDHRIPFEPLALPVYLSLWVYISLPPALMLTRAQVIDYGLRIGALCLAGLAVFYLWPNAVPPAHIDWDRYPGMAFLKGVDAAGNACPSLHVATAVFAAFWLHWMVPSLRVDRRARWFSAAWCVAIVYSTMATKQHVAIDVLVGTIFGTVMALALKPRPLPTAGWSLPT
ncbi:phosphatase PAP2 family protein [Ramlibacter sp. MMS24-I3-19]|uniref:phosphatase PAP2 family protein n=1 Tax=Ramlibacter sp. MMS24-I3-19 TaxID=3416606 RepID=UPI003D05ABB9